MPKLNTSTIYFIGQFIVAMIAVPYGGYVLNARSNVQQAGPHPMLLSIQEIAPQNFTDFKRTTLRPQVRRSCMQQISEQLADDENSPSSASDFCDCYVQHVTNAVTQDDMAYLERFKEPSPEMESRGGPTF